jgi:hypothetical protein
VPRSALACAALLLVAACERAAERAPCPGDQQVRLQLRGSLVEGISCANVARVPREFELPAVVSYPAAGEAALCLERDLAEPLLGAREGDAIDVGSAAQPAALAGCACDLRVVERVRGTVIRDAGGAAVGFEGELVDVISPTGASTCPPVEGEVCLAECVIRWQLAAP